MLGSLLNKPFSLEIDGRALRFETKADFDFALASRTEVPAAKIAELMRFDAGELTEEASSVRQVERHFVELLSRSIQEPGSIGYLLREMDMKLFSQDHEWRSIMQAVSRQPARFNDFKQLALVKYMQYLESRQDVLKGIYGFKASAGLPDQKDDMGPENQFRETVIFDVSDPPTGSESTDDISLKDAAHHLARIPRGEQTRIEVKPDEALSIVLSRHPFSLRLGEHPALIADDKTEQALQQGRNVLGRHPDSDLMIDASYRDVSRTHLIVDVLCADTVLLTDLSSHGTFVPADKLVTRGTG